MKTTAIIRFLFMLSSGAPAFICAGLVEYTHADSVGGFLFLVIAIAYFFIFIFILNDEFKLEQQAIDRPAKLVKLNWKDNWGWFAIHTCPLWLYFISGMAPEWSLLITGLVTGYFYKYLGNPIIPLCFGWKVYRSGHSMTSDTFYSSEELDLESNKRRMMVRKINKNVSIVD